jgi:hypothetical protein
MPASTTLTLNGSRGSVFIIQIDGLFTLGASVVISLAGGVKADTVFWYTGGGLSAGASVDFSVRSLATCSLAIALTIIINREASYRRAR